SPLERAPALSKQAGLPGNRDTQATCGRRVFRRLPGQDRSAADPVSRSRHFRAPRFAVVLEGNSYQDQQDIKMNKKRLKTGALTLSVLATALMTGHAMAAVSESEAAKLGNSLTPVGAEKAG